MPLSEFFADQFGRIRAFMLDPGEVVRVVRVDPDLEPILLRALARMDAEPDNSHALLYADAPFTDTEQWFGMLFEQLRGEYGRHAAKLEERGCRINDPAQTAGPHPAQQFCLLACTLADALPDSLGSLVFLVHPGDVRDASAFRLCIEYLANQVRSPWLKFLVLDPRQEPRLDGLEAVVDRIGAQTFHMPPAEIEKKLRQSLDQCGTADPRQHRRMLGVLAGFAFGRKDYHEAARLQFEWAKAAEEAGEPAEAASALYNLGNTLLGLGALEHAERFLVQCCELCLDHGVNGVLPMALTNLGVTLSRRNRPDEAVQLLLVAYKTFKAQGHRPGQAFVFDALASVYWEQQRLDEAERAWLAAHEIYAGITSAAFADLRGSGCEDVRGKLERFYEATGRPNRLEPQDRLAGVR